MTRTSCMILAFLCGSTMSILRAEQVVIVVENTSSLDGFYFTPLWVAAHDGSFDIWSRGQLASDFPGLESLAEAGDTAPIDAEFQASAAGLAGGQSATIAADTVPAPVFTPGESATFLLDVGDPQLNRFFSYGSMVIPSNDLFFANGVPNEHEIFDAAGHFVGPITIEIRGSDVIDAGTELNDIEGGAAFTTLGGTAVDEMNPLAAIEDLDPADSYLQSIIGAPLATGGTIGSIFAPDDVIARITVKVPSGPKLRVTIENTSPTGGFFLTPFWVAAHDGNFDVWSGGQLASDFPGLEMLAEEGNTGPLSERFAMSSSGSAGGVQATFAADASPPPVFSPGETQSFTLPVGDATLNRYFSYASMVIPSNDLFVATSVPTTYELFDGNGDFVGPVVIEIRGMDVVDAGTEVNDIEGGAAFSTLGGTASDEANPLADLYDLDPSAAYLNSIVGTTTASGDTITAVFGETMVIARITIDVVVDADFVRGDVDGSGVLQVTDGVRILQTLFAGGPDFPCERAADVNDSNVIDLADAVILLTYLFQGGFPPPAPFPGCGPDGTPDLLSCEVFAACP
ncbi:MAG: spondin domain-containing protein [Planctomycetes bacterium]|nr:spondin domain-containing protein [Planctomycetota bacterium]